MLRHKRDYRAIILSQAQAIRDRSVNELFVDCDVEVSDTCFDEHKWSLTHCFLYESKKFTNHDDTLEGIVARRRRRKMYRYNFYVGTFGSRRSSGLLLAVPFKSMGLHLAEHIADWPKGGSDPFARIRLSELVERVMSGEHAGGRLTLRGLEYAVAGDENGSVFTLEGKNVLRAELYKSARRRLQALRALPRRIRVEFGEDTFRPFRMTVDRYGNLQFRVGAMCDNLTFLGPLLNYIQDQQLLSPTHHLPFLAISDDEEME